MAKYERAVGRGEEAAAAMRSRLPEVEPEEAEAKRAWDAAQARLSEHLEDLASDRTELAARKDDLDRVLDAIALADEADSEQADAAREPPAAEPEVVESRVRVAGAPVSPSLKIAMASPGPEGADMEPAAEPEPAPPVEATTPRARQGGATISPSLKQAMSSPGPRIQSGGLTLGSIKWTRGASRSICSRTHRTWPLPACVEA